MIKLSRGKMTGFILISLFSYAAAADTVPKTKTSKVIKIETTIVGTKEQPKFLTIVPWKTLQPLNVGHKTLHHKLHKQFSAIEPSELKAQLLLHKRLSNTNED